MDFYLVWYFKNDGDELQTKCYTGFLAAFKFKKRMNENGFHAGIIQLNT